MSFRAYRALAMPRIRFQGFTRLSAVYLMLGSRDEDAASRRCTGTKIMDTIDTTGPADVEIGHDGVEPQFRDALGLIELLHQRVQEAIVQRADGGRGHGKFCTVFNCIDGRCQRLVHAWCERELGVEYADTITIAGCDAVLINDEAEATRAMNMAKISVDKHGARDAVIVGHSSCAGNPVSEAEHRADVENAAGLIARSGLFRGVTGLFVDVDNKRVEFVCSVPGVSELQKASA